MISFFTQTQQGVLAALFFVFGVIVGRIANLGSISLTKPAATHKTEEAIEPKREGDGVSSTRVSRSLETQISSSGSGESLGPGLGLPTGLIEVTTGLLFAGYVILYI